MPPTTRPVRPPTFPRASADLPRASLVTEPAFESAEPAEEVTRDRPSDALDWKSAAFSFAAAVASEVDEALRMPARRAANVECRSTARDAARDMVTRKEKGAAMGSMGRWRESWHVEARRRSFPTPATTGAGPSAFQTSLHPSFTCPHDNLSIVHYYSNLHRRLPPIRGDCKGYCYSLLVYTRGRCRAG